MGCLLSFPWVAAASNVEPPAAAPAQADFPTVLCTADQTGGFHDYPGGGEAYEPALFHPQQFALEENLVFMMNLAGTPGNADVYLTMTRQATGEDGEPVDDVTELECREVRGADGSAGLSCVNLPPSEMILINRASLRFTRAAAGGWTFTGATGELNGDSIFVEYGRCLVSGAADPRMP